MISQQITPTFDLKSLLPPFHEHDLPSNGMVEGSPSKVSVRGLTVKELKHLTASGRFDKKVFDTCISSCIKEPIDIGKLLVQDYNYVVYLVRLYTSGQKAAGAKVCEHCKAQFNFQFDLTESVEIVSLNEPLPLTTTVNFPRFKDLIGFDVTMDVKPLTRADLIKVDSAIKASIELSARLNQPVTSYPLTELLKTHVVQISGFPVPVPKDQVLDYLDAAEASKITEAYPDNQFGLQGGATVTCPICSKEQTYAIPFTDLFFS